jgi:hypothetical protein
MTNAVNIAQIGSNNTTFRNKIINGAMVIDQRNAGASVTPNNSYTLDRWQGSNSQTAKYTVQQSSTSTTGFINSLLATSSSAYTVGASDIFALQQKIEGLNCADLAWGTANAATVTLSFWVRSSLTGTFGGSLQNNANNRSYPFSYTISSANTFEQKTITIAGDTTGTWLTTSGTGIIVTLSIGAGATVSGTAGAWAGSTYYSATGATSVVGTSGATFYITGVQLEAGSAASPFEYRLYGTELQLCQRYFFKLLPGIANNPIANGAFYSTTSSLYSFYLPVTMRAAVTTASYSALADFGVAYAGALDAPTVITFAAKAAQNLRLDVTSPAKTAGGATQLQIVNTSGFLSFDAEL